MQPKYSFNGSDDATPGSGNVRDIENSRTWVFMVRHGARADRDGEGSGRRWRVECEAGHEHDPPLSAFGETQAAAAAALIQRICALCCVDGEVHVVCSPLRRCLDTAIPIYSALDGMRNEDEGPTRRSVTLSVDTGLYELFTQELFPTAPRHVISPVWRERSRLPPFTVDDSIELLTRFPEKKRDSTCRTLDVLQKYCSRRGQASAVVLVAHQFNINALVSNLLKPTKGVSRDWKKEASATFLSGVSHPFVGSEGLGEFRAIPPRFDFDTGSVSLVVVGDLGGAGEDCDVLPVLVGHVPTT